jgi:uncharacterized protein YbjT (DUF2867 family)
LPNNGNTSQSKEDGMTHAKKIVVIGASGGSGQKTVEALIAQGNEVTAVSRSASRIFRENVRCIDGSALDKAILKRAIRGQDAVIVTLGISENPFLVRFFGPAKTTHNIRSAGTRLIIDVMKELGIKRLLVQTSYGSGPSKHKLRFIDQLFFSLLLKPQIADTEVQDEVVRESGLDWTIIQPVHLSNEGKEDEKPYPSMVNEVGNWSITRKIVGQYNAHALFNNNTIGRTIALSSAP